MKKIKRLLVVAALALIVGATAKVQTQAAVTGVKQIDDSKNSVKLQCNAILGAGYYYLELSTDNRNWVVMDVSSNPSSLYASSLTSGTTYYARVGTCTDYNYSAGLVAVGKANVSASIDVVTAPETGASKFVQTGATQTSFTGTFSGSFGANYYQIYYNDVLLGASTSTTVKTSRKLTPGTSYWTYAYPCRRSSSGYIARGSYSYDYMKTMRPKVSTSTFGITSALSNINVYYMAVSNNYNVDGFQWQFFVNGKLKKTVTESSSSLSIANFINGKAIQYRVRPYIDCGAKKIYGEWSGFKSIGYATKVTGSYNRKSKKLTVKWSKVTGAKSYTVSISTKQSKGFKKVKTVKASKRKVVIKKYGKKKLKKGKIYWIRIVPNVKSGKKTVALKTSGVYSYRIPRY